ncbi:FAD/NAD-P-binding domain-containing protein [Mycena floridula]|nr:FAD/NAD-P-binding domain-containing protein [Mycena floridula]
MVAEPEPFRVAICGGGISGLATAVALAKYPNIQVDVYEAAERFKEIGAGVMLWSRTWKVLQQMGLADQFSKIANTPPTGSMGVAFDYRRSDQPEEGFRFTLMERSDGCIRFHRAEFLDVLVDNLPSGVAHFGHRLTSYEFTEDEENPVILRFANGLTATCDVLVGCDGIKSGIRKQLFTGLAQTANDPALLSYVDPVWTGLSCYRGLIPLEKLPDSDDGPHRAKASPMMYCGKSKHIVCYAISQGNLINVVACFSNVSAYATFQPEPWVVDSSKAEMLETFKGWEPEVCKTLECIENPQLWKIFHLKPLPLFFKDRVVLIGDAAHACTPHLGAGAGQALEDAYMLANLLGETYQKSKIPLALESYQHVRLPLANRVLKSSYAQGCLTEFDSTLGDDYETVGSAIVRQWDWIDETDPKDELSRAIQYMREAEQR